MIHTHPVTGRSFHVGGRRRPAPRHKRFFSKYRDASVVLPTPPASLDYSSASGVRLAGLADVLANDSLGDCTAAAACHIVDSFLARSGSGAPPLVQSDAVGFYSLSTGYDPADSSTDQGGDEPTVLEAWRLKGIDGKGSHAIAGWLDVAPTDVEGMRQLLFLFGNLYFGVELPDAWTRNMPSGDGFVWDAAPSDPNQGHAFCGLGYTDQGVLVDSWGLVGTITWEAIAQLCAEPSGELHCVLSKEDFAAAQATIPGIDWATMVKDFDAEGGTVSP
jgi:hypothetical protein